jgi:hypothetical protein
LLGLIYPFARSSSSWTLRSFNSSWFIRYGALAGGATPRITSITWSTHLLRGNLSGNSSGITFRNSFNTCLMHLGELTKLVASFGSSDTLLIPWRTPRWVQTENNERARSRGALPSSQHFGVEGCARAPGWD